MSLAMKPEGGKKVSRPGPLADCSAVILAGGFSTRFGAPKAQALWNGRRMIEYVVTLFEGLLSSRVIIVCRERQGNELASLGYGAVVHDNPRYRAGPLRGIVAGLAACETKYAFVLSCDAPCLQPALLLALRGRAGSGGAEKGVATVPRWRGREQVLTALYRCSAGPLLEQALAAGESSPTRVLQRLGYDVLPEKDCLGADRQGLSFININTTHDLELLHKNQASTSNSELVRL